MFVLLLTGVTLVKESNLQEAPMAPTWCVQLVCCFLCVAVRAAVHVAWDIDTHNGMDRRDTGAAPERERRACLCIDVSVCVVCVCLCMHVLT